jgi:hypothetical protein
MLQNLISALLRLRRGVAAREVLQAVAQDLARRTNVGVVLGLWCAVGACLDNDMRLAERLLHETPSDVVPQQHRGLWNFASAMLAVCRDKPEPASLTRERAEALDAAFAEVRAAPDTGYLARLAMRTVAHHVGRPWRIVRAWVGLYARRLPLYLGIAYLALLLLLLAIAIVLG